MTRPNGNEKIPPLSGEVYEKLLGLEIFRKRVKEIVEEHSDSVTFMKKVREYAGMEFDSRLFTTGKYWITLIITAVVTSGIGFAIAKLLPTK